MDKRQVRAFLEAFAVGDAFGKTTEYCSQDEIRARYARIDTLLTPQESLAHQDLEHGRVTDDTEQNVYLIHEYARQGRVDAHNTAMCLLRWVEETDAASKYIGPNSLKALRAIRDGTPVGEAGKGGTTCGGMMRAPAAFLFSTDGTLVRNVVECLSPTHNTGVAIEAGMCYVFALDAAAKGLDVPAILDAACEGALEGKKYGSHKRVAGVGPSCAGRIRFLEGYLPHLTDDEKVKSFLYNVIGATLASADVCACAFGLFMYAGRDVMKAIRLAAEMGGDTDTVACLAAGLCTLYAGGHNIDRGTVSLVERANGLSFEALAGEVMDARGRIMR